LIPLNSTQGKLNSVHDNGPRAYIWSSFNMPVTTLRATDADAILQQISASNAVAPPGADYYLPLYSAPNYAEQMTEWLENWGDANKTRSEVSFDFNTGNSVDEDSLKHTSGDGDRYVPWLSLGNDASDYGQVSSMLTCEDQLQTTITMSWDDQFRAIDIQSGRWYVHLPSLHPLSILSQHIIQTVAYSRNREIRGNSTYKLKSDAPDEVKGLARVVQFVVVSNLAFEVEFSGDAINEFDSQVSSGAIIRLFGIPIAVNRDADEESDITHSATWNADEGKLSVKPKPEAGFASVVALVGEKV